MKGISRVISSVMVLLILLSNINLPDSFNVMPPKAYASENNPDPLPPAKLLSVSDSVYGSSDGLIAEADDMWLTYDLVCNYQYMEIINNLSMPVSGLNGSSISWTSSDITVVKTDGTVIRPSFTRGDAGVTVSATITKGTAVRKKDFFITVKASDPTSAEKVAYVKGWLSDSLVLNGNKAGDVKTGLCLPLHPQYTNYPNYGINSGTITWVSSNEAAVSTDGRVTRPGKDQADVPVTLTAAISLEGITDYKVFNFTVTKTEEFPLGLKYDDFGNKAGDLILNGKVAVADTADRNGKSIKAVQFNNDGALTGGSVYNRSKLHLNADMSFSTAFSYRNVHPAFTLGEGGFTFVMHSSDSAANSTGITGNPSLSIAFNTTYQKFQGAGQATNYSFNEKASVIFNGNNDATYENGRERVLNSGYTNDPAVFSNVWIEYNGITRVLEVRFSTSADRPRDAVIIADNVDLGAILKNGDTGKDVQDIYIGFIGSAGNAKDKSEIWGWYFKNDPVSIDFAPYRFIDASKITLSADPPGGKAASTVTASVYGDGGPAAGLRVDFSTSMGLFNLASQNTDSAGNAAVVLSSDNSGIAVVKAAAAGGAAASIQIPLTVTDEDRVAYDEAWLTGNIIINANSSLDNVTSDLYLPSKGLSSSDISWSSGNTAVVGTDGKVKTPLPAEGDKHIQLTAAISKGSAVAKKTFNITVKVLDKDIAAADWDWLTGQLVLKGNSALENVTADLLLPVTGKFGSAISWTSTHGTVAATDGKITRPANDQGDKLVVLTAAINKGSVTIEKKFGITVKAIELTDAEKSAMDKAWLTDAVILNGNISLANVSINLNLPVQGPKGSAISWTSSDETVIASDGKVSRPSYTQGNREVTLTAAISNSTAAVVKIFNLIVAANGRTDIEAITADIAWLDISRTLGVNISQSSVTHNLVLPGSAPAGSSLTWLSSLPGVISDSGIVKRPEYLEGNKTVILTVKMVKGSEQYSKTFEYIVLALPDTTPPAVTACIPGNNSTGIAFDTRQIIIEFSEDILRRTLETSARPVTYGIKLNGPSIPNIFARIDKNKLIITLDKEMTPGAAYELYLSEGIVKDISGNPLKENYKLVFTVEPKPLNKIDIASVYPADREGQVPVDSKIYFTYNYDNIAEGSTFYGITLRTRDGEKVSAAKHLSGNKVTLDLGAGVSLKPGMAYELLIPAGAVRDRYRNESSGKTIQFITKGENVRPEVTGTYPFDGQKPVDINQYIQINFSEAAKAANGKIKLMDDRGNPVGIFTGKINDKQSSVLIQPSVRLKPNTEYTVIVPYNFVRNTSGNNMAFDYSMKFTTGGSSLGISKTHPLSLDAGKAVSLNSQVEIEFSSAAVRGPNHADLKMTDSAGKPVAFNVTETENKIILAPLSKLIPSETYAVDIPQGAYKNAENDFNDTLRFIFSTAKKLEISSFAPFSVRPSPNWLEGKPLEFSAEAAESTFKAAGRSISSFEWSFGDGSAGNGKKIGHTYISAGNYTVRLSFEDNYGISYEYSQEIKIGGYNSREVKIEVSPGWHQEFTKQDAYNSYNRGYELYTIELSYGHKYISDEKVTVLLYRNGVLEKTLSTVTTGRGDKKYVDEWGNTFTDNGTAFFPFWFSYIDSVGTYELVFVYGNISGEGIDGTTVRVPVTMSDNRSRQDMNIKLYNKDTGKFVDYSHGLFFILDGVQKYADRKWLNDKEGYCYVIGDVEVDIHTLKLDSSNKFTLHNSIEEYILHSGVSDVVILPVQGKQLGLISIKSEYSDSNNRFNTVFISGISMPALKFEFEGDWDYLTPGYYEITTSKNRFNFKTKDPWIELDPSSYLIPGEKLLVRMVTRGGMVSPWLDAKVETVHPPKLDKGLNFVFSGGEYRVDTSMNLGQLLGEKIGSIDDIPMLGHSNSFGLYDYKDDLTGILKRFGNTQYINLKIDTSVSGSKKKKKPKMLTVGYEMSADIYGNMYIKRDNATGEWKFDTGEFTLMGDLSKFWKKGYVVPKINVGAEGQLYIGAIAGGSLYIDRSEGSKREYSGILYFEPYVTGSIYAGLDWVKVEGFVDGRIPSQVHIPTGYLQVTPSLTAGIKGTFLTYTETLFSKKLSTSWNNGKEKVTPPKISALSQPVMLEFDTENAKLAQIPRNYLNRDSQWLAQSYDKLEVLLAASELSPDLLAASVRKDLLAEKQNPVTETLKNNIYPYSEVNLAKNGDELWLVWTEDNPLRSSENRTQMKYSVLDDGKWSEPAWIGDDGTGDFTPALAAAGNGILMAWQNINKPMKTGAELSEVIKGAEISVTESVYNNGSTNILTLTADDKFDHSPKLAANGNSALLVWTKSEGLGVALGKDMESLKSPANSDRLMFSGWNGSTWSKPEVIDSALPTVMNSSLYMHGNEALLLYTLDLDSDQITRSDNELFARTYNGKEWSSAIRITDNQLTDSNPKAAYSKGEWFITWYQNGSIVYKEGLLGETKSDEFLSGVQDEYEIALYDGAKPQIALIYRKDGNKNVRTLSAAFYDINNSIWSNEIPLTAGDGFIRSFSPAFTPDGRLNAAYTRAEVISEIIEGAEYFSTGDRADLRMLSYTPVHDLSLSEEDGISINPDIPIPGTISKVSVTVRNQGDFPEKATLYLYDGTPDKGKKIGEAATGLIPAHSSQDIELDWLVEPNYKPEYNIHAVVNPENGVTETDKNNNVISCRISASDVVITDTESSNIAKDDYLVTASVSNRGSTILEDIKVYLRHVQSGQVLGNTAIRSLKPGQTAGLSFLISSNGLSKDTDGNVNMELKALLADTIPEYNKDNNISSFVLKPDPIIVESIDPAPGDNRVGLKDNLILTLNIIAEKGTEFERITLADDCYNNINIIKTITGKKLTVTPVSPLDYNTRYTLTIPEGALADSYGHIMAEQYSLSFTTTTSSPRAVFAYPFDTMKDAALNTDIEIQFDQPILKGTSFNDIAIYGPQSDKIPAAVSLQDRFLYIKPTGRLDENKQYTLSVPKGAVTNNTGEAQQEDYSLVFTTGMEDEAGDGDNGNGDKNNPAGTAVIDVIDPAALRLQPEDALMAVLDVTQSVKDGEGIKINLSGNILEQLKTDGKGLTIITGKAVIKFPAEFIEFLARVGGSNISLSITERNEDIAGRVSTGVFDFSITAGNRQITEFDSELIVAIPLDMSKVENAKRVIVCVYDEASSSWQPIGGVSDRAEGTVTFRSRHFSSFAAFETIKSFEDLADKWGREKVEVLASRSLISGKSKKSFDPEGSITRAEFTAMIVKSLYMRPAKSKGTFSDVLEGSWYADSVETAFGLGLVSGTGEDKFEPDEKISREQMAVIVYQLYKYKNGRKTGVEPDKTFEDSRDISTYAKEAADFVLNAGIMVGSDGRFEPKRSTTRQEAAVLLYKLLEYMGEL